MTLEQLHNTINVLFIATTIVVISSSLTAISGINNFIPITITIGVIGIIIGGIGFTAMLVMMSIVNEMEREESNNAN